MGGGGVMGRNFMFSSPSPSPSPHNTKKFYRLVMIKSHTSTQHTIVYITNTYVLRSIFACKKTICIPKNEYGTIDKRSKQVTTLAKKQTNCISSTWSTRYYTPSRDGGTTQEQKTGSISLHGRGAACVLIDVAKFFCSRY